MWVYCGLHQEAEIWQGGLSFELDDGKYILREHNYFIWM